MVEKLALNYLATALVDIPAVNMSIARSLKILDICGVVLCDKTALFRVVFYCPQHKVHLCNDDAVNLLLDMPQQSGGLIILAKEKCALTGF